MTYRCIIPSWQDSPCVDQASVRDVQEWARDHGLKYHPIACATDEFRVVRLDGRELSAQEIAAVSVNLPPVRDGVLIAVARTQAWLSITLLPRKDTR